jgi:hypothetical protein
VNQALESPLESPIPKKQIVRTLIHEIIVDLDESRDEVILIVHLKRSATSAAWIP